MPKVLYKVLYILNFSVMNELTYSVYKGCIGNTSKEDR